MKIPCFDGEFEATALLLRAWKANYPAIDVEAEIVQMNLWLTKNKARRPKKPIRFIETWLKRCRPSPPVKMHLVDGKMSEREMLQLGAKHGIAPRAGESWTQFAARLKAVA